MGGGGLAAGRKIKNEGAGVKRMKKREKGENCVKNGLKCLNAFLGYNFKLWVRREKTYLTYKKF